MSFEDNPADDRYHLDQCIDEIKSLQSQIATLTAERDEARKEVNSAKLEAERAADGLREILAAVRAGVPVELCGKTYIEYGVAK